MLKPGNYLSVADNLKDTANRTAHRSGRPSSRAGAVLPATTMVPVATMVAALFASLTTPANGITPGRIIRWTPVIHPRPAHLVSGTPIARVVIRIVAARAIAVAIGVIRVPPPCRRTPPTASLGRCLASNTQHKSHADRGKRTLKTHTRNLMQKEPEPT